ncbi:MAG: tyrosine-type recombinase/integrase [Armatimonadetes bacterium]|nr:tyrosine-type recombinase/integrase [Armatimonadota bacterium]
MSKPRLGSVYRRKKRLPDGTKVETGPYWIAYYIDGRQICESARTFKKTEAERLLKLRGGEVAKGLPVNPRADKTRVDELLDLVIRDYETNGKAIRFARPAVNVHLRSYFGGKRAATITTTDIHCYVEFRRGTDQGTRSYRGHLREAKRIPIQPASNATINRELALLKRGFYLGLHHTPPKVAGVPRIPMLAENNVRKGFFEHEEFREVREHLPEELRPVLTFAYYTGCRRGEILSLQWSQVSIDEKIIRLEPGTTKNDEARQLPLFGELYQMVAMQRSIRDTRCPLCPWVFFRLDRFGHWKPIRDFKRSWLTACAAAGLSGTEGKAERLFHDLRRTGVRNLIRAGVPTKVAMLISGHKTMSVFERYNIIDERDLREAARKLDNYLAEKEAARDNCNSTTADRSEEESAQGKLLN